MLKDCDIFLKPRYALRNMNEPPPYAASIEQYISILRFDKMEKEFKIVSPRYQQIAADIAAKIVSGHYLPGEKIYARSSIASQYGVSSETARRAICVLADMKIVDSTKGSGVVITSLENARKFVRYYSNYQTVSDLKREMLNSIERQSREFDIMKQNVDALIDRTERFKATNPFIPFEITIDARTAYLGKTASDVNFWHNTSATIIAVRRGEELILSPGPYTSFQVDDVIYFIGDDTCAARVREFLYPGE